MIGQFSDRSFKKQYAKNTIMMYYGNFALVRIKDVIYKCKQHEDKSWSILSSENV